MNASDIANFRAAIINGKADDQLDGIVQAVQYRKQELARKTSLNIVIGKTRVRVINQELRPRYIIGAIGTVVGKKIKNLVVRFDEEYLQTDRFRGNVRIDPSWVEIVE